MSVAKRQREQAKRDRQQKKAERKNNPGEGTAGDEFGVPYDPADDPAAQQPVDVEGSKP
jgi:hypothetical protein